MGITLKKLTRTSDKFLRKELRNAPKILKQAKEITKGTKRIKPMKLKPLFDDD